ncbi:hypothetical protein BJ684DRAFT_14933 [Piptocephalis cylindrospora]|uniref:Uncharacterized protein n=1 Tax=Piptocephalis cylindrospora TaxID=1907219 RepID=A0A4P9Y6R6_9FUNG|nr:hypothetical protein BJ684DRAFT_14933 [Piptocephalis cylindrospora]|eukprot:RKP14757.1 hypothetical protein BJ684DRAFT_14933 [Piptocephalis cylindrospora]
MALASKVFSVHHGSALVAKPMLSAAEEAARQVSTTLLDDTRAKDSVEYAMRLCDTRMKIFPITTIYSLLPALPNLADFYHRKDTVKSPREMEDIETCFMWLYDVLQDVPAYWKWVRMYLKKRKGLNEAVSAMVEQLRSLLGLSQQPYSQNEFRQQVKSLNLWVSPGVVHKKVESPLSWSMILFRNLTNQDAIPTDRFINSISGTILMACYHSWRPSLIFSGSVWTDGMAQMYIPTLNRLHTFLSNLIIWIELHEGRLAPPSLDVHCRLLLDSMHFLHEGSFSEKSVNHYAKVIHSKGPMFWEKNRKASKLFLETANSFSSINSLSPRIRPGNGFSINEEERKREKMVFTFVDAVDALSKESPAVSHSINQSNKYIFHATGLTTDNNLWVVQSYKLMVRLTVRWYVEALQTRVPKDSFRSEVTLLRRYHELIDSWVNCHSKDMKKAFGKRLAFYSFALLTLIKTEPAQLASSIIEVLHHSLKAFWSSKYSAPLRLEIPPSYSLLGAHSPSLNIPSDIYDSLTDFIDTLYSSSRKNFWQSSLYSMFPSSPEASSKAQEIKDVVNSFKEAMFRRRSMHFHPLL